MALIHDFLLLDLQIDGEWEAHRFIHDPRVLHLHDDLVRYMEDTLAWIPTFNPTRKETQSGLCMWGPTIIGVEGAGVAERVFRAWADLFAVGPSILSLTGVYSWAVEGDAAPPVGERGSALQGGCDKLAFPRDEVVAVLRQMAEYAGRVQSAGDRLYLLHQGV